MSIGGKKYPVIVPVLVQKDRKRPLGLLGLIANESRDIKKQNNYPGPK